MCGCRAVLVHAFDAAGRVAGGVQVMPAQGKPHLHSAPPQDPCCRVPPVLCSIKASDVLKDGQEEEPLVLLAGGAALAACGWMASCCEAW